MPGKDANEKEDAKPQDKAAQKKRLEGKMFGLFGKKPAPQATGGKEPREEGGNKPPAGDIGKEAGEKPKDEKAKASDPKKEEKEKDETLAPDADVPAQDDEGKEDKEKPAGELGEKKDEKKKTEKEKPKPAAKEEKVAQTLPELRTQKEQIEELLSSIEDSYRDATLPENTYREVKEKNEKQLAEIIKKIEALGGKADEKPSEEEGTGKARVPTAKAAAGQRAKEEAPAEQEPAKGDSKAEALIKLLEKKIEEKLKDVIATASVEVTDKRVKKMDERLNGIEASVKSKTDAIDTDLKTLKAAAETVARYDKQFNSMNTEIEKVKALVDSVKEAKNVMDDKLQRVNENFAEIRSIVYQREAAAKDHNVLLDKLKDTVSQIDSARILREFTVRDEQIRDVNSRLERLERSNKMLTESMNKIKGLMTDIGSLENVIKASKHVGEKLEKIQEIEERMKSSSTKLNSLYLDMKKKLDEFSEYKVKQDKQTGITDDLVKNVEELTRRLAEYATKADVSGIKDELKIVRETAKKAASAPPMQAAASPASPELLKLREEKGEIETMLETLEENFKAKAMSEDDYTKAKNNNLKKLSDIVRRMKELSLGKTAASEGESNKYSRAMLMAKLRESYETGEITKQAYDRSMKLLLLRK